LYRYAGKFLAWKIHDRCEECDLTYAMLTQMMGDVFAGRPVSLTVKPWLNHWWKLIWHGVWHAPAVMINGRKFSQGAIPDPSRLLTTVGRLLDDPELLADAEKYSHHEKVTSIEADKLVVYGSPACPHCRKLLDYLIANDVAFMVRDVSQSQTARSELHQRTGGLRIPVVFRGETCVVGFDRERIRTLAAIAADREQTTLSNEFTQTPRIEPDALQRKVAEAQQLLRDNQSDGRTRASRHLYPHQWNWDTGFIARGYLHFDVEQAYREVRNLFAAQWSDGFLPHIVFNPLALDHFPGPDYWKADRSGRLPTGCWTSGISQPPVHASMLAAALQLDPDHGRATRVLAELYPQLRRLHDFFFRERDPAGEHLVTVVHPWESGIDNTPLWDEPLSRLTGASAWADQMQQKYDELVQQGKRPPRTYIAKYSLLVEHLFQHDYDWQRVLKEHPFQVQDVLFNVILCRAERDLAVIAEAVHADAEVHRQRAARMAAAINEKLWDPLDGTYYSYDVQAEQLLRRETIFSFLPLYAGCCDSQKADEVLRRLETRCFCVADRQCVAIPSYDMCQADYDGEFYWRGPVWFNVNWFLAQGLRQQGERELASWIEDSLLQLVIRNGFFEYYSPETGRGLGASEFSWTAALFIDLAASRAPRFRKASAIQ